MRDSCRQPLGINAWIEICCPKLAGWQASASACEIPCAKPLPQELSLFLAILLCKKLRERFKHAQRKPKQLRCKLTKKKRVFNIQDKFLHACNEPRLLIPRKRKQGLPSPETSGTASSKSFAVIFLIAA
jgi:hypothetical protein